MKIIWLVIGYIWQSSLQTEIAAVHTTGRMAVKMMKYSVSWQPSRELEPDYTQSGGQISLLLAQRKAAEDFPGEFTAVFSFTQCYILYSPEMGQIEKRNPEN